MISLILYGRNDNYGYNLHKRAAISLNCMAEVLDDPDDEILFVDYNTPDDMPTFVEAILDTLTDRARSMLRVLRVRPSVHRRWAGRTHLNALEPPARNIALRRSNPNNRWILSTNTDMVFVLRDGARSLSQAVKDLPRGYYGIPRFEMPESLWESLDRKEPRAVISAFARWGRELHLDEVVHSHKSILYDGPGDFQLLPRDDLMKIHGFSEAMLLGWHVDSNLAKRCLLLYGETRSLFHKVAGYHCDHTKVVTPAHGHDRLQNDMVEHITQVRSPEIPAQADTWGAPDAAIEDLRFPPGRDFSFAPAIAPLLGPMPASAYEAVYTEKSWNRITYPARHVIPYLADQIATFPRDIDIGYCGLNDTLRALLAEAWRALGFTGRLLVHADTAGAKPGCAPPPASDAPYTVAGLDHIIDHAALFVLDFGVEEGPDWPMNILHLQANPKAKALLPYVKAIQAAGMEIVAAERGRMAGRKPLRRIVLVNTINTELAGQVDTLVGQAVTPYCTRVRHGFVKPDMAGLLHQRRAEADRYADGAAAALKAMVERYLPFELLDQADPGALLDDARRAELLACAAERRFDKPWQDAGPLSLSILSGDFDRRLAAYLEAPADNPGTFVERLTLLRVAAAEAMARPWPAATASVIEAACARFLGRNPPADWAAQAIAVMFLLCSGAPGQSLDGLAAQILSHCGDRMAAAPEPADALLALAAAEFALARPGCLSEVGRLDQVRTRLLAPALRLVAAPDAGPTNGDPRRIALLAAHPFALAVDPSAAALRALIDAAVPGQQLRVIPLRGPDPAFLALARRRDVEVAAPPETAPPSARSVAAQVHALAEAINAWSPAAAIAVGDSALAPAALALSRAPVRAVALNRLLPEGLPGFDKVPSESGALAAWLRSYAAQAEAKGGAVGVAAR